MKILNFTKHALTKEQLYSLVEEGFSLNDIEIEAPEWLKDRLTFTDCPSREDIVLRAQTLANYAESLKATVVILGGAPFFMGALETALVERGIKPRYSFYAFTERVVEETTNPDGTSIKTSVFTHSGWVM